MTILAFPAPALPVPALRRSWLASRVADLAAGQQALALLRRLNPKAAQALGPLDAQKAYRALLQEAGRRFPVAYYDIDFDEEERVAWAWRRGIPVAVGGWHYDDSSPALALGVLTLGAFLDWEHPRDFYALHDTELAPNILQWWGGQSVPAKLAHERGRTYVPKPPRGREWVKPWDGLPDLALYCQAATGTMFLDTDDETAGYGDGPDWTLGNVRALEREWQRAKPMNDRIYALVEHIEERPQERLRDLYEALRETPGALALITRRKGGTLVRAFAKKG